MVFARLRMCVSVFWSFFKVSFQVLYGGWRVSRLSKPIVSIFGSARLKLSDPYSQQAHKLAKKYVDTDISVLTGGGPGIMEAASCGAVPQNGGKGISMGIGVKDLGEGRNPCVQEYFELDHFYARKWLLTRYSVAFVVFPGGFGTLDELTEVLTLIQTRKLHRVPIVLIGSEYWASFMEWARGEALKHGTISKENLQLFTVTDDLEVAYSLICDECRLRGAL